MLFIVDFDGTLSPHDTVDGLLERFADPQWREVERAWLADEIDAAECMTRQLHLVRAERAELEDYFAGIAVDPGFRSFCDHVPFATVAVVSDGLDHAVESALGRAGVPPLPVYANRLHFVPEGIGISFPYREAGCRGGNGVCKCAVARGLAAAPGCQVVLVGDGKSDACLARSADVVFAKGSLAALCEREGIAHYPFDDFRDVLAEVRRWDTAPAAMAASLL